VSPRSWDGYPVSMIALPYAHGNQIPFLSVNTCVHELLHALLQDIFVSRPKWYQSDGREFRSDWYATVRLPGARSFCGRRARATESELRSRQ